MKCPSCGQENRPGATFCSGCGALLTSDWEEASPFDLCDEPAPDDSYAQIDSGTASRPILEERPTIRLVPPDEPEAIPDDTAVADERAAVAPGTMVGNRFEVVDTLEETPELRRYRARDWCRCPACGYDDNAKGDTYCLNCGATLQEPVWADLVEIVRRPPPAHEVALAERGRDYYVTYVAADAPGESVDAGTVVAHRREIRWGRATDTGLQREHNEDYAACWEYRQSAGTTLGLFVVADGLGGQDSGEVASRMATETVWEVVRERVWTPALSDKPLTPEGTLDALKTAVQEANRQVYDCRKARESEMSTTITMALVSGSSAYIANVGDSRVYLHSASGLRQVTKDHSLVQQLVDSGQITPHQVYTHPQRNLIYRSIGDHEQVETDTCVHDLQPDDRLVLCSDGLWEMVRNEGIEDILLAEPDPQRACDRMVHNANLAGGEDNISAIVIQMTES